MSLMDKAPEASVELKKLGEDVRSALDTLQKAIDTKNKETLSNVEMFFKKYEDENQKLVRDHAAVAKKNDEFAEKLAAAEKAVMEAKKGTEEYEKRVRDLELVVAKKGNSGEDPALARETPEYKNFFGWMAYHPKKHANIDIDVKTLRSDSETQGAYLIPQVMDNEIRRNITEISPVRLYARNRTSPGKTMDIPRRLGIPVAYYEGEGEQDQKGQSTYGSEQVTLFRQSITVPATLDMMVSSAFDLEREIAMDVGEAFGYGEGRNYVLGNGDKGPQGFVADSRIEVIDTAATGEVDFIDMANVAGKLKRGQNPMWFMNRRTLAKMWSIKSTIGVPIWTPVAGNTPATIWGFAYSSDMIDLADAQTGAGAKPIVFADMRRGYEIYDMVGISVIRDDLTRKREAITEWTFRRYNTGRVIIPEAFKIMRIKA